MFTVFTQKYWKENFKLPWSSLLNKLGTPGKTSTKKKKKKNCNSWSALQLMWGFAVDILQVVLFTILCFNWSVKEHGVANNFKLYNPLSLFCPFVWTKNKSLFFKKLVVWLIVYRESSCSSKVYFNSKDFYKGNFLLIIPVCL